MRKFKNGSLHLKEDEYDIDIKDEEEDPMERLDKLSEKVSKHIWG